MKFTIRPVLIAAALTASLAMGCATTGPKAEPMQRTSLVQKGPKMYGGPLHWGGTGDGSSSNTSVAQGAAGAQTMTAPVTITNPTTP